MSRHDSVTSSVYSSYSSFIDSIKAENAERYTKKPQPIILPKNFKYGLGLEFIAFIFSTTILGLSIAYINQVYYAAQYALQKDPSTELPPFSTSNMIAMYIIFPVICSLFSVINTLLWHFNKLHVVYSLIFSIIIFVGAFTNLGTWFACDYGTEDGPASFCYQKYLARTEHTYRAGRFSQGKSFGFEGVSQPISDAKNIFSLLLAIT
ncbi:hypothetical protein K402DRAFT_12107 [Aulographum hederae CBS 113979]|uniref:Uncharacterized protein n=1 Tax=Aulographum hederae CBS 113979 TaxID=1176131 RepID=A0A6G1H7E1_9PEZI|nr:hypothetical protein K402DRAFT_12107 [Aulographum hederae CBS 113979]